MKVYFIRIVIDWLACGTKNNAAKQVSKINVMGICCVAVITSALHAEGPQFDPEQVQHLFANYLMVQNCLPTKQKLRWPGIEPRSTAWNHVNHHHCYPPSGWLYNFRNIIKDIFLVSLDLQFAVVNRM